MSGLNIQNQFVLHLAMHLLPFESFNLVKKQKIMILLSKNPLFFFNTNLIEH
jgi:hypothetical protein